MKYLESFYKKLGIYRQKHNLSLEDIATLCFVDDKTVASWESDQTKLRTYPTLPQLIDLCVGLKVAMDTFLDVQNNDDGQLELPGLRFIEESDLSSSLDALGKEIEKVLPSEQELELLKRFRKSDDENRKLIIQLMSA
ncbi:MAG: helix-turn-helix transcriptional regulator [Hahellaceae bacterium]|nr:helix-turn-helix transcriptional regulator [Hahellaceae bacterium]MCP5212037.1 helix-turn-helix transcriptional regulator [Hahellaceae bacterium]